MPDHKVVFIAVTAVADHHRDNDFLRCLTLLRGGDRKTKLLLHHERTDRFLPVCSASLAAHQADHVERPQPPLPRGDFGHKCRGILRLGVAPAGSKSIEQRRRLSRVYIRPEQSQVLGIQPTFRSHDGDRLLARAEHGPFREGRGEVFFERQLSRLPKATISVQIHQADGCSDPQVNDLDPLSVELPDLQQRFIRPVPLRGELREANSIREQHRMTSDLFAGIEILRQQRRRHRKRIASVCKTLARGTVGGEFASRIEVHARQITDRVGVFRIVQPSQHDGTRIARARQ